MTRKRRMHRAKLLDRRSAIPHMADDSLVRTDILLHNLDAHTLQSLRRAMGQGLVPSGLNISGDDEPIVVLRLTQPPAV